MGFVMAIEMAVLWPGETYTLETVVVETETTEHAELEEAGRQRIYSNGDFKHCVGSYMFSGPQAVEEICCQWCGRQYSHDNPCGHCPDIPVDVQETGALMNAIQEAIDISGFTYEGPLEDRYEETKELYWRIWSDKDKEPIFILTFQDVWSERYMK